MNALAAVYSPVFDRELDALTEIVVTTGATEGIYATVQGLVDPGDEVILIEPFYDSYPPSVIMAGGTPVYVPLRPRPGATSAADWQIDMEDLQAAISPKTKLIIINTPLNPVGKMYSREELLALAQVAQEHDLLVLSDEVYEWMTYDGTPHVRIATLPGMWERTVTLGSAGKTFSVTGWKIGWAIAPEPLAHAVLMAHQWIPFAVTTPLQEAVGAAFEQVEERNYLHELSVMYQDKREILLSALNDVGLPPLTPPRQLLYSRGYDRPGPASAYGRPARRADLPLVDEGDRRDRDPTLRILQPRTQPSGRECRSLLLLQDGCDSGGRGDATALESIAPHSRRTVSHGQ